MFPKEGFQYPAIVQLLLHFRWTLIGLFASDTENGQNFMRTFPPMLVRNGICFVISQRFSTRGYTTYIRDSLSKWRQVNVFVHFIEYVSIWDRILPFHLTLMRSPGPIEGKVWILTNFEDYKKNKHRLLKYIHSIWNFAYVAKERPNDDAFEPYFFLEPQFQDLYLRCSLSKHVFSVKGRRRCTQKAPLETQEKRNRIRVTNKYQHYSMMKTLAQALNAAYSSRSRRRKKKKEESLGYPRLQPWQSLPESNCAENCEPGFVKRAREGEPVCCYDCVPCPEGTFSTQEVSGKLRVKCPLSLENQDGKQPQSFYSPGDHLIGIFTTGKKRLHIKLLFNVAPSFQFVFQDPDSYGLSYGLKILFNIQTINKNSQFLHNLTLGYSLHDNYLSTFRTSDALLDILSTGEANVPNYGCGRKETLLALIDGARRDISIQMSTLGGTYKVPQISFARASEALSDKSRFPFFHQMLPKEGIQYSAIVQLLLHFRWTLIGLFASDTEKGENFMRTFPLLLVRNGICVVISQLFPKTGYTAYLTDSLSKWRQVNVFVHFIEFDSIWNRILPFHLTLMRLPWPIEGKVWLLTSFAEYPIDKCRFLKYIHSIWKFCYMLKKRPEDSAFEPFFFVEEKFQDHYFHCSLSKNIFSFKGRRRCTQKAPLETQDKMNRIQIPNYSQYYSRLKTLAQAMNAAYCSRLRRRRKEGENMSGSPRLQPWQVWGSRYGSINLRYVGEGIQRGTISTDLANLITQGINGSKG